MEGYVFGCTYVCSPAVIKLLHLFIRPLAIVLKGLSQMVSSKENKMGHEKQHSIGETIHSTVVSMEVSLDSYVYFIVDFGFNNMSIKSY